jgi:hypothetical protein
MQKQNTATKDSVRSSRSDSLDTWGFRGAGATWQASFGMPLNEVDLLFAVRREPVANRIVFQVAHDVFDNWFRVEEISDKPDANFDREVQQVLAKLDAKSVFTQMAVFERLFGWAIIAITFVDYSKDPSAPVVDPKEIRELIPYSSLQFNVQNSDENKDTNSARYGLPVFYTLRRGLGSGEQIKLHFSRTIHSATRLLDHPYKGMSVLEPVYDDLTVLRNIRWGLGQTIERYAAGFADITLKGAKKKQLREFEAEQKLRQLNARSYFVHDETASVEWKGAAGKALNPEPYYLPIMENISAGTGIPLAILRGAQAGALTGSEVNEREYFKLISDAQSRYEPAIRQLIDTLIDCGEIRFKHGIRREYRIVWLGGFELNEKDKASVELQNAQARNLKTGWMTVDEIRAEEGLDELPDGSGKVVLGLKNSDSQPFGQSEASADEADMNRLERFFSWLWKKKQK